MPALMRPAVAALGLFAALAGAQTPLVSVPELPDNPGTNPPRPLTPQPIPAAALFDYDTALPLRFTVTGSQSQDNFRIVDGEYDGAPNSRVSCSIVLPPNPRHAPAVLFLHDAASGREEFIPEALSLARRGMICLLIDAPAARALPEPCDPAIRGHDAALCIRSVIDCRRAVDLLRSRPDVDPTRIALVGHGGSIGAILGGTEPRIQSFALLAPIAGRADEFRDRPSLAPLRDRLGPARSLAYINEMRPLDTAPFLAAARPLSVFLQFGSRDREVTPAQAQQLAAAAPSSTTVKTYLCGHELNDPQATTERDNWLATRCSLGPDSDDGR